MCKRGLCARPGSTRLSAKLHVRELEDYNAQVDVHDPWIDAEDADREYGVRPVAQPERGQYDAIVIAVPHHQFAAMGAKAMRQFGKPKHLLYDLKHMFDRPEADLRL